MGRQARGVQVRNRIVCLTFLVAALSAQDLMACGDKFLVSGRGTRYQRPKNARAASVLIYAAPSTDLAASANTSFEPLLKQGGHRFTTVTTFDQLSNVLAAGRFDVVIATASAAASVKQLFAGVPDAAVVLAFETAPKATILLKAIDNAVLLRDSSLRSRQ